MSEVLVSQLQSLLPPVSYDPKGEFLLAQLIAEANALQEALVSLEEVEAAIFPETAGEYIADWERVFDLTPAPGASQADRIEAVLAAMADLGGQSISYFVALARRMGLPATVDVAQRALAGVAVIGDAAPDGDTLYQWRLNVPMEAFRNSKLETLIKARRPANTEVSVGYGKAIAERLEQASDRLFNTVQYVVPGAING